MTTVRQEVTSRLAQVLDSAELDNVESWPKEIEQGIFEELVKNSGSSDLNLKKIYKKNKKPYFPVREQYLGIARKVISNLSSCPNKDDLIDRLIAELVSPRDLGSMSHMELDPNNFQARRIRQIQDEENNGNRRWKTATRKGISIKIPYDVIETLNPDGSITKEEKEVPDSMLTCGKCGMKKTSSYEMQTRSADEPMTIFATCLCCGNRWRF